MPLFRRTKPEPEPEAPPAAEAKAPVRVLVVDDEEDLRALLQTALEREGFDVVGATGSAETALALVEHEPHPDIVLLDLHMPDVTGLDLMPQILERAPDTKIVACSSMENSYMVEATIEAGATSYIVKGVSVRSIAQHLHRVAESGRMKMVRPYPLRQDYRND
ncbi:response regulator [Nocardioides sp. GCM10027113]|uniref:response regulator n=1 Tax=unclassified Nocardioides TaxID=2615069 RepID=UPI003607DD62